MSNCITAPIATTSTVPLAWLKEGSGYSEAQTFYLFPATGGMCYIQVAYSELALSPLAQVTVRVATPTCTYFKSFNNSGSAHKVGSPDRASSTTNDYSVTRTAPGKITVALKNKDVMLNVELEVEEDKLVAVGDGKVMFAQPGAAKPDGFLAQTFGLRAQATGVIMAGGVATDAAGAATIVHQHQGVAPHKIGAQWNFFTFASPSVAVTTISGTSPMSTYKGERYGTMAVHLRDQGSFVANAVSVTFPTTNVDAATGYAVPTTFVLTATLNNGHTVEASGSLDFAAVNRVDVLGELPWLLRKAVQLLVSKPFVYQFVQPSSVVVKDAAGNVVAQETSAGMFEVTYTNPA
ncbi:oxidative stress survival, Svf1-like protein [Blastocladiella britannica]|nr:oxidative stress survival, Svf1-like protein [Blastocladiella britannica]